MILPMRKLVILLLQFFTIAAYAQTGKIAGTVTTKDGQPAGFVNLIVSGSSKGAMVDAKGNYQIDDV